MISVGCSIKAYPNKGKVLSILATVVTRTADKLIPEDDTWNKKFLEFALHSDKYLDAVKVLHHV